MQITDFRIGTRLSLAFAALLLLLTGIAYVGWSSLTRTKANIDFISNENKIRTDATKDILHELSNCALAVRNYILYYSDSEQKTKMLARLDEAIRHMNAPAQRLHDLVKKPAEQKLEEEISLRRARLIPLYKNVLTLVDADRSEYAITFLRRKLQEPQDELFAALDRMIALQETHSQMAIGQMNHEYRQAQQILMAAVVTAILTGAALAYSITRSITIPIARAVGIAQTVAAGDLSSNGGMETRDELGQLLKALKEMNAGLLSIVLQVRSGTDRIAAMSSEIAGGNLDLSSRTEQQAGLLKESAVSMEELVYSMQQNLDNAHQADLLARSATNAATQGGAVVTQVIETMDSINASSKRIVDIISVIDGIAFQTNILALNAAVEAARAGEQGRGFAVVATEVRSLAQRSANAAREIKTLIGDSVGKVEMGFSLVNQAGSAMQAIVDSIRNLSVIVAGITVASKKQATGIEQSNHAIATMNEVTRKNAELVKQAATTAQLLEDQANGLKEAVSLFSIPPTGNAAA